MRSFLDAKAMAKALKQQLGELDLPVTHSQALGWGKEMMVTDPFSNRIRFCELSPD